MAQERNAVKVGVVTIVVFAAFFAILLWVSKGVRGDTQTIVVRFRSTPDMPTLAPGSDVLVGGQKVGKITRAELRKEKPAQPDTGRPGDAFFVVVEANILASLKLRSDCRVIAEGPPLGGDGVLKIDLGAADPLPDGKVIDGSPPAGFAAVLAALQEEFDGSNPGSLLGQVKAQLDPQGPASLMAKILQSVGDINAMTAALRNELGAQEQATLLAKLHQIVDSVNGATSALRAEFASSRPEVLLGKVHLAMDTMNDGLGSVSRLLKANEPVVTKTLKNVETATENIAAETDPDRLDSLMAHFKQASRQLNETLADISVVTGTTREVVVLNRENINRIVANFKESSDHLKTGVKYVLRHPWRLLNAPAPGEMKQQAIFDAARNFAEAATRIEDATAQLRVLAELHGGNIPGDNPDLARIESALKQTREKYAKAEAELWRQLGVN